MGKVALKLNGKPLDLNPCQPALASVIQFLDKSAPDELFNTAELMSRARTARTTLSKGADALTSYRFQIANKMYWGNPKAIAELKRQTA